MSQYPTAPHASEGVCVVMWVKCVIQCGDKEFTRSCYVCVVARKCHVGEGGSRQVGVWQLVVGGGAKVRLCRRQNAIEEMRLEGMGERC